MANKEKSREADVQPLENPLPEQIAGEPAEQEMEQPEAVAPEEAGEASPGNNRAEQPEAEQPSPEPGASVRQNENQASIENWASALNIPGWQHAALCRLMGWAAGKTVSEAEYRQGLAVLAGRRMGGGRL